MMKTVIGRKSFPYHTLTQIMDYFSCSPLNTSEDIRKINETIDNPNYAEMRHIRDMVTSF